MFYNDSSKNLFKRDRHVYVEANLPENSATLDASLMYAVKQMWRKSCAYIIYIQTNLMKKLSMFWILNNSSGRWNFFVRIGFPAIMNGRFSIFSIANRSNVATKESDLPDLSSIAQRILEINLIFLKIFIAKIFVRFIALNKQSHCQYVLNYVN